MTLKQSIIASVDELSIPAQRKLLDYALSLKQQSEARKPWPSLLGALARPGLSITEQDIAEARREMWQRTREL